MMAAFPHLFLHFSAVSLSLTSYREWPNPVLLKQPEDSNLNLPVWDPRVSMTHVNGVLCRHRKCHLNSCEFLFVGIGI